MMVGNLGEAAAEAIGADPLLTRVGSQYHDIGKTKRPYFFVENQFSGVNPHDKISPTLSTLIITSHVKDGVEMARQHKLPKGIGRLYSTASRYGPCEVLLSSGQGERAGGLG